MAWRLGIAPIAGLLCAAILAGCAAGAPRPPAFPVQPVRQVAPNADMEKAPPEPRSQASTVPAARQASPGGGREASAPEKPVTRPAHTDPLDIWRLRPPETGPDVARSRERIRTRSILVVGDSLSVGLGITMADVFKGQAGVKVRSEGKISSGLGQTRVLDWEKRLRELIAAERPDALVVLIGGNDANIASNSAAWSEGYRRKVQSFLQIPAAADIPVFWVELPPMEDKGFTRRVKTVNEAAASACSKAGGCHFIPTWELCANEKGEYTAVKTWQGRPVTLRVSDGAHFTRIGYETLSRYVLGRMADLVDLPRITADRTGRQPKSGF